VQRARRAAAASDRTKRRRRGAARVTGGAAQSYCWSCQAVGSAWRSTLSSAGSSYTYRTGRRGSPPGSASAARRRRSASRLPRRAAAVCDAGAPRQGRSACAVQRRALHFPAMRSQPGESQRPRGPRWQRACERPGGLARLTRLRSHCRKQTVAACRPAPRRLAAWNGHAVRGAPGAAEAVASEAVRGLPARCGEQLARVGRGGAVRVRSQRQQQRRRGRRTAPGAPACAHAQHRRIDAASARSSLLHKTPAPAGVRGGDVCRLLPTSAACSSCALSFRELFFRPRGPAGVQIAHTTILSV